MKKPRKHLKLVKDRKGLRLVEKTLLETLAKNDRPVLVATRGDQVIVILSAQDAATRP